MEVGKQAGQRMAFGVHERVTRGSWKMGRRRATGSESLNKAKQTYPRAVARGRSAAGRATPALVAAAMARRTVANRVMGHGGNGKGEGIVKEFLS